MNKVFASADDALRGAVFDGMSIAAGGFGVCGIPERLILALRESGVRGLTVVSNNCGLPSFGLGLLLQTRQIRKMVSSYVGENPIFEKQYLDGELELEFTPQGTLAEKLRAGGAGIPAFYVRTGHATPLAEGKRIESFNGQPYVLEESITVDLAVVKAQKGDRAGNLVFNKTARNFNPLCAKAARVTIAEVEELVEVGELTPEEVHLPGIYVHRIFQGDSYEKPIEIATVAGSSTGFKSNERREWIARRITKELKDGDYVNLGIGIPTLIANMVPEGIAVTIHSENGLMGMGPFPARERSGPGSDQCREADRDRHPRRQLLRLCRVVRDGAGRAHRHVGPRQHAGQPQGRHRQLGHPRCPDQGTGRRDGPGLRRQEAGGRDGAHGQGRLSEGCGGMHTPADRKGVR